MNYLPNKISCWNCLHANICWMFRAFQKTKDECTGQFVISRHADNERYGDGKSEIGDIFNPIAGSCLHFTSGGVVEVWEGKNEREARAR